MVESLFRQPFAGSSLTCRLTEVAHLSDPDLEQVHDYDPENRLVETDRGTWPAPWLYAWDEVGNREHRLQDGEGWQNSYGLANNRLMRALEQQEASGSMRVSQANGQIRKQGFSTTGFAGAPRL